MENLEKEFVTYQETLALKELGFNEKCFKMSQHKKTCEYHEQPNGCPLHNLHCGYPECTIDKSITPIPIPTYSQAFRWFRKEYNLVHRINKDGGWWVCAILDLNDEEDQGTVEIYIEDTYPDTYEDAELACLQKLIEIVKTKNGN